MNWPKISVVTPSFNQGKFIEETILSVINQNYPNLEYIIIDGGSTDETIELIRKYEPWITYWVSEPDRGQSHAINKGLEKCTGEIFNWLNSDDWYEPNALYEVAMNFLKNPSAMVVSGYENHITLQGNSICVEGTFLENELEKTIELCQIAQPSTFFKLSAIKQVSPIPEDIHYIMDGELWVRFLLMYGQEIFVKISKPLVNFRLHENSKTMSNAKVDNFLYERSSIISDLQRFVNVPSFIRNFWIKHIFQSSQVLDLNRHWQINESVIQKRKLRVYYIKKYITRQLILKDYKMVGRGIIQLFLNMTIDGFTLKAIFKFLLKRA